jgi:hypothetical protein
MLSLCILYLCFLLCCICIEKIEISLKYDVLIIHLVVQNVLVEVETKLFWRENRDLPTLLQSHLDLTCGKDDWTRKTKNESLLSKNFEMFVHFLSNLSFFLATLTNKSTIYNCFLFFQLLLQDDMEVLLASCESGIMNADNVEMVSQSITYIYENTSRFR